MEYAVDRGDIHGFPNFSTFAAVTFLALRHINGEAKMEGCRMRKSISRIALAAACVWMLQLGVFAEELLIPGGQVIGLQLYNDTVTVAAFDDALGGDTKAAGLQIGDEILSVNGAKIKTAQDVCDALDRSDGSVELRVNRKGKERKIKIKPKITDHGPRLGVYLRSGITGIGTVTWYDPESKQFGTLGHGVNGADGELLEMNKGVAYDAQVASVRKGVSGEPGQLKGAVAAGEEIGALYRNTQQGVFGTSDRGWKGEALPVGEAEDIHAGAATIRSTVNADRVQEYSVEILKIYPGSGADGRNLLLKITDPALLETTGGIVQGMSGSPIVQNGKLVGAVTHVLVNDPTTGYGIFIENMLEAAI